MWEAPWHWVVLIIVVVALFGYKKLPDASRAVGRSLRIFRTELKGMTEDDKARTEQATPELPAATDSSPAAPVVTPAPPVTAPAPPATDAEAPVQTAKNETPAG